MIKSVRWTNRQRKWWEFYFCKSYYFFKYIFLGKIIHSRQNYLNILKFEAKLFIHDWCLLWAPTNLRRITQPGIAIRLKLADSSIIKNDPKLSKFARLEYLLHVVFLNLYHYYKVIQCDTCTFIYHTNSLTNIVKWKKL